MTDGPSARFAISPDEQQIAVRSYNGDSWFVAQFNVVKGRHLSDIPDDWTYFVPATEDDKLAEEAGRMAELIEEVASNLAWLKNRAGSEEKGEGK